MSDVYLVWHEHELPDGEDERKFIGVYASRGEADAAIKRLGVQPGFDQTIEGFSVEARKLGQDNWSEGFWTWHVPLWTLETLFEYHRERDTGLKARCPKSEELVEIIGSNQDLKVFAETINALNRAPEQAEVLLSPSCPSGVLAQSSCRIRIRRTGPPIESKE